MPCLRRRHAPAEDQGGQPPLLGVRRLPDVQRGGRLPGEVVRNRKQSGEIDGTRKKTREVAEET
jgi:hypothetical protein